MNNNSTDGSATSEQLCENSDETCEMQQEVSEKVVMRESEIFLIEWIHRDI